MKWLRNLPIKRKLTLVSLTTSGSILLLVCAVLFAFQLYLLKQTFAKDLSALAEVVAANASGAVAFKDQQAAEEILSALKAKPHIVYAGIDWPNGSNFVQVVSGPDRAVFRRDPIDQGHRYDEQQLLLAEPIKCDHEILGTLRLQVDVARMYYDLMKVYAGILALVLAGSIVLAFLLSSRMQQVIALPIMKLSETARAIATRKDYSVRAEKVGEDELGLFTDTFNQMLTQIQTQDEALRDSEGRYRLLFELNPLPMFVYHDTTLEILAVNESAVDHYGWSHEEFRRMSLVDLLPGEDASAFLEQLTQDRRAARAKRDFRHRKKDGTHMLVEVTAHEIQFSGLRARLALCIDITERRQAEQTLVDRFRVESLVNQISTDFINVSPEKIDPGIDQALQTIGEFAGVDRGFVMQFAADRAVAAVTHEWCAVGVASAAGGMQSIPLGPLNWAMDMLNRNQMLNIPSVASLPPEATALRELMQEAGAKSLLAMPMMFSGSAIGILGILTVRQERAWAEGNITLLQLAAQIFVNALERKRAERELEAAHQQLLDTSRQAGMAEVATGVLHNVGNVLNSVNVSSTLVIDRLRQSKVASLPKVSALLHDNASDLQAFTTLDPKGKQILGYLESLAKHLTSERDYLLDELESVRKNIDHIKHIVAMQQNYAKVSGVVETVFVAHLVDDAIQLNAGAFARHHIQVIRDFDPATPPISVEKHKVLQIVVNLIRNAKHAMEEQDAVDKRLTLKVAANGNRRVKIQVRDNGIGILPENLNRIFAHGFTTRRDGHGFGLHSGALAAKELGGTLSAHSDGPGKGAVFTLELPIAKGNGISSL